MEKQWGYHVTKIAGASPVAPCLVIFAIDVRGDTEEVQRIGIPGKVMQASACVGADKRVGVERCSTSARGRRSAGAREFKQLTRELEVSLQRADSGQSQSSGDH